MRLQRAISVHLLRNPSSPSALSPLNFPKDTVPAEPTISIAGPDADLVVIGGGVNGVGVARDAALRGCRVVLFERNDFAFGASGNSSGMIHGGVRYLTSNPAITANSCLDSGYIQRIAPHLLFRIPFLYPVSAGVGARTLLNLVDGFFEAYDRYQPLKQGKAHARLSPAELRKIEPALHGNVIGGVTFDEWGIDGARLVVANALDAQAHGARLHIHTSVERLVRNPQSGAVQAVIARNVHTGAVMTVTTRAIVNATGAWSPRTIGLAGLPDTRSSVRGGKGIHVVYDRRLTNYALVAKAIDGRDVFLEPWENMSILGTTDDDYYGDLDDVRATAEEVRYLEQAMARVFPAIRDARAIGTYAGVRPTLYAWGPLEDKLSREHAVVDHEVHGAAGLFSLLGGKLASYRIFAEEATNAVMRFLGRHERGSTHLHLLPGGDRIVDPTRLAHSLGIDAVAARRLVYRHGSITEQIGERILDSSAEAEIVCICEPVLEAEVRHVLAKEHATSVADVSRRTRLGLGACGGLRCALRCGQIVAESCGLTPREGLAQSLQFIDDQADRRRVAMGTAQVRQDALLLASFRADIGLNREER